MRIPRYPHRVLGALRIALLAACSLSDLAWSAGAGDWSAPNPGIAGANGDVDVVAVAPNGDLYVGGRFTAIGDVAANRIARWDGSHWSALGDGVYGTAAKVHAIAFDTLGNVYVGGYFEVCGGLNTGSVARWDGKSWSALGKGIHGSVFSLVPGDSGGVVAAGQLWSDSNFSKSLGVASWIGGDWVELGTPPQSNIVDAMLRTRDGALVACGENISRWDGGAWQRKGARMGACHALAEDRNGKLYAGGSFTDGLVGDTKVWGVAAWNGTDWEPLMDGPVEMVHALATDSVGNLYAAGLFDSAGGRRTQGLAKWDRKAWSDVGGSLAKGNGSALAVDSSGAVVVGGSFRVAGDLGARALARWDGSRWSSYGNGLNGPVHAVAWDREGRLYVGGEFTASAGGRANSVAMWDGQTWHSLGGGLGLSGRTIQAKVHAVVVDSFGNLYVGGEFETAGGVPARSIAKWDGQTWSALGGPDNSYRLPEIDALAIGPDGLLYAGGAIGSLGGVDIWRVGVWDGSKWTSLEMRRGGQVLALAFDAQDRLVAAGLGEDLPTGNSDFDHSVMRLDDTGWTSLTKSSDERVRALALLPDGRLVAGGPFTWIGETRAFGIAAWNGANWDTLPGNPIKDVMALAVDRRGGLAIGMAYRATGDYLSELREGVWLDDPIDPDNVVRAMAFDSAGRLAVGGEFGSLGFQWKGEEILFAPYLALRGPATVSVAPPTRPATSLDGRKVRLEILSIDGRRKSSREIASWSAVAEMSALRDLGRGAWMVRRIASDAKGGTSLVVVP